MVIVANNVNVVTRVYYTESKQLTFIDYVVVCYAMRLMISKERRPEYRKEGIYVASDD